MCDFLEVLVVLILLPKLTYMGRLVLIIISLSHKSLELPTAIVELNKTSGGLEGVTSMP